MAAEGDTTNIVPFIFSDEEEMDVEGYYIIPHDTTHLIIHESIVAIPEGLCYEDWNLVEVYCHAGVKIIENRAFWGCCLRRVIIPGVEVVEYEAFCQSQVTYIECNSLEIIGRAAFAECNDLSSINLPSAKVVEAGAFQSCEAMTEAKFGKHLESLGEAAFWKCPNLERISTPLKNGLFTHDNIFTGCSNLKCVDLVDGAVLNETVSTLLLEEWRNDMIAEVDSINQILLTAPAGYYEQNCYDVGGKVIVIRDWIERVLRKVIHYKAEHRRLLNEAASTLHLTLPNDIVMNNVLPFLKLPSYTFEGEDRSEEEE